MALLKNAAIPISQSGNIKWQNDDTHFLFFVPNKADKNHQFFDAVNS